MQYRLPNMVLLYTEPAVKSLRSHPRFQSMMQSALGERTSLGPEKKKYKKSLLEPEKLDAYKAQLSEIMEKEQLHLDPGLGLRDLAAKMQIPPNHMSQLLNEGFDQNFSGFVNSYRLEAFKEKPPILPSNISPSSPWPLIVALTRKRFLTPISKRSWELRPGPGGRACRVRN